MAQGNNKPDLSDLKARLGLKKQGAANKDEQSQDANPSQQAPADGPGPASAGPPRGNPAGNAPPQASGPPPGARQPPASQGPPPGAQARPPAAARPAPSPSPQPDSGPTAPESSSRPAPDRGPAPEDIELDDEDLKAAGGSTFSLPVVVLMVVLLGVGVLFGWMASSTVNNRQIYNARSDDAARVHEALGPKLEAIEEARAIVAELPKSEPDYEAVEKLSKLEVGLDENVLSSNRLLLGPKIISSVTSFAADTVMLQELLSEHQRLTKLDKDELTELVEGNEVLKEELFAVFFDYDHLASQSGSEKYRPKPGRIVTVPEDMELDDDGKVEVALVGTDRTLKTRLQSILPVHKTDILKTGGRNALQRYQERNRRIELQLKKFEEYTDTMMKDLKEMAEKDKAPLINL